MLSFTIKYASYLEREKVEPLKEKNLLNSIVTIFTILAPSHIERKTKQYETETKPIYALKLHLEKIKNGEDVKENLTKFIEIFSSSEHNVKIIFDQ